MIFLNVWLNHTNQISGDIEDKREAELERNPNLELICIPPNS